FDLAVEQVGTDDAVGESSSFAEDFRIARGSARVALIFTGRVEVDDRSLFGVSHLEVVNPHAQIVERREQGRTDAARRLNEQAAGLAGADIGVGDPCGVDGSASAAGTGDERKREDKSTVGGDPSPHPTN